MIWAVDPAAAAQERASRRYIKTDAMSISVSPTGLFFVDPEIEFEEPVPSGLYCYPDIWTQRHGHWGWIEGKGPDFSGLVPYGVAAPPPIDPEYKPGIWIQTLFQDYGLWRLAVNTDTGLRAWNRFLKSLRRSQPPRADKLMLMRCQTKPAKAIPTQHHTTVFASEFGLTGVFRDRPESVYGLPTVDSSAMVVTTDPVARLREEQPGRTPLVFADELFTEAKVRRERIQDTTIRTKYDPKLDDPKPRDPERPQFDPDLDDELPE